MKKKHYCLITPVKNEAKYIRKTINSVISQSVQPIKWVIVDDGSTDNSSEIISEYLNSYDFINLISIGKERKRNFASKAFAFNIGCQSVIDLDFQYIGNLDADVSFTQTYYESVIEKFELDETLGIAGGKAFDIVNDKRIDLKSSLDSVGGPVQFFRKECFLDVNGYLPLKNGGIDAVAEFTAKMKDWKVQTFPELYFDHHRRTGSEGTGLLRSCFKRGIKDYSIGYHPLFEFARCLKRSNNNPIIIGSVLTLLGYLYSILFRVEIPLDKELINFIRKNQLKKVFNFMN